MELEGTARYVIVALKAERQTEGRTLHLSLMLPHFDTGE